nr:ribonuclease E/G [Tenuifilaceae bacterium]
KCPTCKGTGEVSPTVLLDEQIENQLSTLVTSHKLKSITLKLHPYIAAFLNKGFVSKRMRWSFRYHCRINVTPMSSYHFLEYHFFDSKDTEIGI